MEEHLIKNNSTVEPWHGRYNYTTDELVLHYGTQGLIGVLTIFSAITNMIVIYVFSNKNFGNRTTIKYLFANISLSDEMFIVACLVEVAMFGHSTSCTFECRRFLGLVIMMSGFVSAYTMALIAFKRYYGIAFPMHEMVQNWKKLPYIVGVILIWVFSISFVLYFERFEQIEEYNETLLLQQCTLLRYTFVALKDHPYYPMVGLVIVPLTFGLFFSLMTIVILLRRKLVIGDQEDIDNQKRKRKAKLRSTFMIAVMIVSFVISWFPITLLGIIYTVNLETMEFCDMNYNLYNIVTILLMSAFWVNPVIYWYMSPDFRRGVTSIFRKRS